MNSSSIQTPEEMIERWMGVMCSCDPDVGHLCECCHDIQVVREAIKERDRLRATLQRIALLGDNMSDVHHEAFGTGPGQPIANGWRVAEMMREAANDVVGSLPLLEDLTIYKRAFDSMAAQMIHPKMTGLEMAEMQLRGAK
jgi:hypothetical protein